MIIWLAEMHKYMAMTQTTMIIWGMWWGVILVGTSDIQLVSLFKHLVNVILVYFIIVYRPFKFLYKVSGLLMLFTMLVGYAICFMNIAFLSEAHCATETTYGRMG